MVQSFCKLINIEQCAVYVCVCVCGCYLQAMFLNLLFKSVKFDPELGRVKAFLKRILQVCAGHAPPFVCGCLYMLSEVHMQLVCGAPAFCFT